MPNIRKFHIDLATWGSADRPEICRFPVPADGDYASLNMVREITAAFLKQIIEQVRDGGAEVHLDGFGVFAPDRRQSGEISLKFFPMVEVSRRLEFGLVGVMTRDEAEELTSRSVWGTLRRPPWWANKELRLFITSVHRTVPLAAAVAEARQRFPGVKISRSGLGRYWQRLDVIRATTSPNGRRRKPTEAA